MNETIFNARLAYFWDGLRAMMLDGGKPFGTLMSEPPYVGMAVVLYLGVLVLIMRSFYYILRRL